MCSTKDVRKNVERAVQQSKNGRITARSAKELKSRLGADDMRTPQFQEILAALKQKNQLRGFSLKPPMAYIQG